jgi:Tfp pilus assembly protein PilX
MPKRIYRAESGAILIVSLIILLAMSLIVLGASSNAILQENMTGSMRQSSQIFQVAESALREAEIKISELDNLSDIVNMDGFYESGAAPSDYFNGEAWGSEGSITAQDLMAGVTAQYFIEFIGEQELSNSGNQVQVDNSYNQIESLTSTAIFRIVVRSSLNNTNFSRVISSYYSTTI